MNIFIYIIIYTIIFLINFINSINSISDIFNDKNMSKTDKFLESMYVLLYIIINKNTLFITILFLPFMIYNPIYQSIIKTINTINIGMVGNTLIKKYNNYSILSIVFILFISVYISYKIKAFIDVITKDTDESNKLKYIHVFPIISLGFIMYILLTSYHRIFDHKLFSICDNNNILTILDKYKSIQFNIYYTIITYIFTNYLLYYIIDKYDTENGKSFIKIYIKKIIDIIKKNKEYILPLPPIIFSVISYYISQKAYNTMKQVKEKMDICQDEFEPKQLNFTKDKCTDCLCYNTSNNKCLTGITNAEECSHKTYVWCPNDKLTHNHTSRNTLYVLYVTILLKILIVFYEVLHNNSTNKGLSLEIIDNILSTIFEKIPIYKYIDYILTIIVAILIFQQFNTLEYNFKSEDIIIPVMVIISIIGIILKLK